MSTRKLQLVLIVTAAAAVVVMGGLLSTGARVACLAVIVAGAWLTSASAAAAAAAGGCWSARAHVLAVAGFAIAELSEPAETIGRDRRDRRLGAGDHRRDDRLPAALSGSRDPEVGRP